MIGVYGSIIIIIAVLAYLFFIKRLRFNKKFKWKEFIDGLKSIQKWILSASLGAVITLSLLTNWISSVVYGFIFPSPDKEIIENTEIIISKQEKSEQFFLDSNKKIDELLKKTNIDARDIEKYLNELPLGNGIIETNSKIKEWYQNRKITSDEKELLFVVVKGLFQYNNELIKEINDLKHFGKNDVAQYLENINEFLLAGDGRKIKDEYFLKKEKLKQESIAILKQSIKATETLFAAKETVALYEELIEIEPFAYNYYYFAFYLQKYKYYSHAEYYYQMILDTYNESEERESETIQSSIALILNQLALINIDKNEYSLALEKYEHALRIIRKLAKTNSNFSPNLAITLRNLAQFYLTQYDTHQAIELSEEALQIFQECSKQEPKKYLSEIASTLNSLGSSYLANKEIPYALGYYEESLKISRELANEDPTIYLPVVASTLVNLANLYRDITEYSKALEKYKESIKIYYELNKADPIIYRPNIAYALSQLALLYTSDTNWVKEREQESGKIDRAIELLKESLKIYRGLFKENPKVYYGNVAITLYHLASIHYPLQEKTLAFQEYEEALSFFRNYDEENDDVYLPEIAEIVNNLGMIHLDNNEFSLALEKFEEALRLNRILVKENPKVYLPKVAEVLNFLGFYYKALQDNKHAIEKWKEALNVYQKYASEHNISSPDVARIKLNIADIYFSEKKYSLARKEFDEALAILKRYAANCPDPFLPYYALYLSHYSSCLKTMNETSLANEKHEEALKIMRKLAKEDPKAYELSYAELIIYGVQVFNRNRGELQTAGQILEKYQNNNKAQQLLNIIKSYNQ